MGNSGATVFAPACRETSDAPAIRARGIENACWSCRESSDQSPVVVTGPTIGRPSAPSRVRRGFAREAILVASVLPSLSGAVDV
jgi:hypothetical protein